MRTSVGRRALAGITALSLALWASPAFAQGQAVSIGTNPPGSVFYSVGSGLAKVVSDSGKLKMAVQPYAGSSTFIPMLNSGEMEFGVVNAVDMALAYRGPGFKIGGRNPFPHASNARLVMRGSPLLVGLVVRKDSPIKSVHDVKGKRMTGEYPAHLAVWYNMFGHLASAGLTWSDVKVVPVPAINEGMDALVQGRADVTEYALNAAKVKEADAAVGVRHVSIDCSPEGERRLRAAVPGYYPRVVKAGTATAVTEDTCVIAYDLYVATGKGVADAPVESTLRAIWDGVDRLPAAHPVFREWTRGRFVDVDATLPYHPAAVRFYKERGVWTPQMEQAQQKLLSLNP
ncbi:MAG: TAXI family TRAP transporter solute-binding subunit [Candidatus Rokubacteria bacterium]|nr:TAXI family TRAP transporter solute-binding subunit [Candidatus Rokubacteria bacterium]